MAHFAQLNENNIVIKVIVVHDNDCGGGIFPESCPIGSDKLTRSFGGKWKQTSYNNNFRKQYAGIGYQYNEEIDKFTTPQPYASWSLNENFDWVAPVEHPDPSNMGYNNMYYWNEETQTWVQ
jgi:hypothetical protein